MKLNALVLSSLCLCGLSGCKKKSTIIETANAAVDTVNDYSTSQKLLKLANEGDADAQCHLAYAYVLGRGVVHDEVEATKWYRKAADQGVADAQLEIGFRYFTGKGVAKDEVDAAKWFLLVNELGEISSKGFINILEGDLSPEDRAKGQQLAQEWMNHYRKARSK